MKLSGVFRLYTSLKLNREGVAKDKIEPPDTRIFSPLAVPGLCGTIGHQMNEFNSFCWLRDGSIYRFEHIETYSSGEVVAKSVN